MIRLLLGVLVALGAAPCAGAADAAFGDPAHVRPATALWTGFYIGAGAGTKKAENTWTTTCFGAACQSGGPNPFFVDGSSPRDFSDRAFRGSFYAGHNWQIANWVAGVEVDFGSGNSSKTSPGIPGCTANCGGLPPTPFSIDSASFRTLRDSSLRARAGYLLMPNILAYSTAGVAWQRVQANLTCSFAGPWCFPPVFSDIRDETYGRTLRGWTIGGGLEWMIFDHWLLRGEYRYSRFGRFRPIFFGETQDAVFTDLRVVTHIMTFGIAYKF